MNPWGLTEKEEQAMRLLIEHGSQKVVALTMGCTAGRLSNILTKASERIGQRTHLKAVIEFDRYQRSK
jgi:DNA-binding CsgD family transcriptional regulator